MDAILHETTPARQANHKREITTSRLKTTPARQADHKREITTSRLKPLPCYVDVSSIPQDIRALGQWCCWRWD
jgi:hypothetical protein